MNFKEALEVIRTEANLYPEDSLDRATWLEVYEVFKNAIPLDEVKQARINIIQTLYTEGMFIDRVRILGILNRLIESEG